MKALLPIRCWFAVVMSVLALVVAVVPLFGPSTHTGGAGHVYHGHVHDIDEAPPQVAGESTEVRAAAAVAFLDHYSEDHSHEQKLYLTSSVAYWQPPSQRYLSGYFQSPYGAPVRQDERPPDLT
ncbi:Uncharacterised protein [Bordetella ansorpii]|uniref:Uncharacterized protein n=2 Tax=Bordetella ansorpii TaxID=288768 RepID=A0A157S5A2_9BORD|nr:Uncharacterised protein [Bordetella ansorpii]